MKNIIILFTLLLACKFGFADKIELKATAPKVVAVGEQFRLTYSLNDKGEDLKVPTFKGFNLLAGPSTSSSSSTSWINGKVTSTSEYTYTYILEATEEGEYFISPAIVYVDDEEYHSNTIKIEVVKENTNATNTQGNVNSNNSEQSAQLITDKNLFVKIDVSKKDIYIGEPLLAVIKVYTRVDLTNFGRSKFPDFSGFISDELDGNQQIQFVRENYNGEIYNVGVIRRVLLYPQYSGKITINPFELECIVRQRVSGGGGRGSIFDDFFGNYREASVMRRSKPVVINVKDLPSKPLEFSRIVGDISMSTDISLDTVNPNDAITYAVSFKGNGNLKLLSAPEIKFPLDFDAYDPKQIANIQTTTNGMSGSVRYEYLIIPRYSGDYEIPALDFVYFDMGTKTYKTITSDSYKVHVRKVNGVDVVARDTNGASVIQSFQKETVRVVGEDIRYIKIGNLQLKERGSLFFGTMSYILAFIIPFIVFIIGIIFNRQRIKRNSDVVRVKNKAATKMARKRLNVAANAMKTHNSELFYDEVLKALWSYVSYKMNIDRGALSRDNVNSLLAQKGVDEILQKEFVDLLDTCEFARYAPASNADSEMDRVYKSSINTITNLDKTL